MSIWERLLFGREAETKAREAQDRWEAANKDLDAERIKFHEARGRILAVTTKPLESTRPMSLPEIDESEIWPPKKS